MLLGISGASLLFGALNEGYYYAVGALFLAAGLYYLLRGQPAAVSFEARRRNRWLLPVVMVATAGATYLMLTVVISPLLVSVSHPSTHQASAAAMAASGQAASRRQAELRVEGMT